MSAGEPGGPGKRGGETVSLRPAAMLRRGIALLAQAGLVTPRADARLLLAHAAGMEPAGLATTAVLDEQVENRYRELLVRRVAGEPVQYLTGRAYFRKISVEVGPGVFIPRPETELVVQFALHRLITMRAQTGPSPVVVDMGTGSGVIAASIVAEYPGTPVVHAVDVSAQALSWARRNLAGTGVRVVEGRMGQALPELDGLVDLVVSNPPYLPSGSAPDLPNDVVSHDPEEALFSGADGMDAIRELVPNAARLLKTGGALVVEHDDSQGELIVQLLRGSGLFDLVDDHPDMSGRPRFVSATRRAGVGE
ncbi:release factor glutamine methyltransferase [Propionibacterium cyclohexanicum]|uniref:Release factor glutamine methyltransferase n=1 Tax=Propionibacterium cyclohexanicum TaxID=64702 RepID=A0A1H9QZR7_9ACTN|nr:peptide chain release factor N(5)-glutamine methyltransferase [Propionibacterium cyclohexanicum]SER65960.1 release factor glutamine methyltransferase [Propionibacterium cyclohexanicum]